MKYRRTAHFKKAYRLLPPEIARKVVRVFMLFQKDPRHPSLAIKKIKGTKDIWEGRIDQDYRFTFHYEKTGTSNELTCVFRNIDSHDACLKKP
jgi:mRNA interferase RelE/StbE